MHCPLADALYVLCGYQLMLYSSIYSSLKELKDKKKQLTQKSVLILYCAIYKSYLCLFSF